ncbi:replication factor C subunit 3-like [Zophobas morio]
MAMCLLQQIYGSGVQKINIKQREFTVNEAKLTLNVGASLYHFEINPSDCGNKDRLVIQALLKDIASTQQLNSIDQKPYKVIIIHECDSLTKLAQNAIRRTMEKYITSCRLILLCNSSSQIISPVRSRCLHVRVAAPSLSEVSAVINKVAIQEGLEIPSGLVDRIACQAKGNLRRALLALEACKVYRYPFEEDQNIHVPEWEIYTKETAMKILHEQTPQALLEIRGRLYELLIHCIPPSVILKELLNHILDNLDDSLKAEITNWAAFYEHRIKTGTKQIYHLEAFVAKFMFLYKKFIAELCL